MSKKQNVLIDIPLSETGNTSLLIVTKIKKGVCSFKYGVLRNTSVRTASVGMFIFNVPVFRRLPLGGYMNNEFMIIPDHMEARKGGVRVSEYIQMVKKFGEEKDYASLFAHATGWFLLPEFTIHKSDEEIITEVANTNDLNTIQIPHTRGDNMSDVVYMTTVYYLPFLKVYSMVVKSLSEESNKSFIGAMDALIDSYIWKPLLAEKEKLVEDIASNVFADNMSVLARKRAIVGLIDKVMYYLPKEYANT